MSVRVGLVASVALLGACATVPTRVVTGQSLELSLPKLPLAGHPERQSKEVALSSLRGKVVLVDVWASWCRPCARSLPFYEDLQHALGPKGFTFVGVDVDEDERAAQAFVQDANLDDLLLLRDPGAKVVAPRFGLSRLPTEFFLDRAGHVRFVHEGFSEGDRAGFRQQLEALLAETPNAPATVRPTRGGATRGVARARAVRSAAPERPPTAAAR